MLQVDMVGAVQIVLHTLYLVCSDDVQQRTNAAAMAYRAEEGLNQLALNRINLVESPVIIYRLAS